MTITESDLRDLFDTDSGDGPCRGVTVADVDRRARRIRRRRLGAAGGVAAAGLAVAMAITLPAGTAGVVPEDVWTGVMSRPEGSPAVVGTPRGGPFIGELVAQRGFTGGGVRKELTVPTGGGRIAVTLWCSGPVTKAALWVDGRLVTAGPCGRGSGESEETGIDVTESPVYAVHWTAPPQDRRPAGHTVAGAVLRAGAGASGPAAEADAGDPLEALTGTEDVEALLAAGGSFDATWRIEVRRLDEPECRDDVRQIDPDTGEMVVLRCGDRAGAPVRTP
ncbi:hypothetical protein PS9374_01717 [Planomonospora sphaerica]|uniref:Uncharacterized protein n=1 Tax=Planomonospora sphaerica TaxID=161355 RepID=A0A161M9I5_9ACTN|nr:hypothetical protein [Planomonospora sphaerica]GAT66073.1 hypothetical protein PS9374_01717 [Planomonospora sphaerica]